MKKRSLLAVASLAIGVVASLTAPAAHADWPDGGLGEAGPLKADGAVSTAMDNAQHVVEGDGPASTPAR
ncbi:hypothetical protein [Kitasatospora sp. NPDC050543]|uniref:hypothetical protein n=1 Tax=Kitasatospora sp. NPDC050543 TaxID=3364054 RepID=UPI0037B5137F